MQVALVLLALIVFAVVLANTDISDRNPKNTGIAGEETVSSILRSLPQEYHVLNDAMIPDQVTDPRKKYTTQIDHVIVSPYGIFVVETKNYSGWIFGSEKSKRWKETFKTTKGHYFYNPIKQNWGHAYALAEHLRLSIRVFKPIVVFSDNCELKVETMTPVIYMSQLKNTILNYRQEIIPQREVELIYNRLSKLNLVGEDIDNQHILSIRERALEKRMVLEDKRCPRCGGELRLRNGKYGAFYGCSNYPNCRYTFNGRYN